MKIKPLSTDNAKLKDTKVILCPSGDYAYITCNPWRTSEQIESKILKQWSLFFDIPYSELTHGSEQQSSLPLLTPVRTSGNATVLYPTALIYVSTSSRYLKGSNETTILENGDRDIGDINQQWAQWIWAESIGYKQTLKKESNGTCAQSEGEDQHTDYWEYANPRGQAALAVLESTSITDGLRTQSILQKALNEPVISSPLMAAKSVIRPPVTFQNDTPSLSDMSSANGDKSSSTPIDTRRTALDFAMSHFGIDPTISLMALGVSENITEDTNEPIQCSEEFAASVPEPMSTEADFQGPVTESIQMSDQILSHTESPILEQPSGLDVEFGIDNLGDMYDITNRWSDPMGDLDNLEFDVTEEDFDFFTSAPAKEESKSSATEAVFYSEQGMVPQDLMLLDNVELPDISATLGPDENKQDIDLSALLRETGNLINDPTMLMDSPKCAPDDEEKLLLNDLVTTRQLDNPCLSTTSMFQSIEDIAKPEGTTVPEREASPTVIDCKQYTFVPPEFAPVRLLTSVNDAKYCDGGKFTYEPSDERKKPLKKLHRNIYRPDYVPIVKKKRRQRGKSRRNINNERTDMESLSIETSSGNGSSSSSESDSSTDEDDDGYNDEGGREEGPNNTDTEGTDEWLDSLKAAQDGFVGLLLGEDGPRIESDIDSCNLDVDSSLSVSSNSPSASSNLQGQDEDDLKALDYLCQQAVMGGYPFLGRLSMTPPNDTDVTEGDPAGTVIRRRRELMQRFYGDAMHTPSSTSDLEGITQQFKAMLINIFSRDMGTTLDHMRMDYPPVLSTVSVKGPLNVQQYYDLSETSQAHSKYGKYQVKKRRQAEPNLDTLHPPDVVVSRQEDLIEGSPKLITFWEKLRLEPYSPKKNVHYFVVFPKNAELETAASQFLTGLSTIYETCLLGIHYPGNAGSYSRGLVPVPLLPILPDESRKERQLRSYIAECQNLGYLLATTAAENTHTVVYMVNPSSDRSSYMDLCRCFRKLVLAYESTTTEEMEAKASNVNRTKLVMQIIPIEHILQPTAFNGYLKFGLKEIAFSVYSKCHTVVPQNNHLTDSNDQVSVMEIYTPAFVLAKAVPETLTFALKNVMSGFPIILDQQETLHIGYCLSVDQRWMVVIWTDNRGELLDYSVLRVKNSSKPNLRDIFDEIWWRTKEVAQRTGFPWTFVIAKLGLIFENELQAWLNTISSEEKVAIVSVDIESGLHIHPVSEQENSEFPHTPGSLSNTPTPDGMNTPTASPMLPSARTSDGYLNGDVRLLLLNHRIG
ncbi:mediator of RNA polymerase II transcription subunit 13 [Apophysomyces ossiformis]|uniref:Mediator of RNA polymerase II transcription subunit 13 n=1 Tax=Apophysomyces ossiformis TaxID=679940 RepID=A0A8H7BHA1_9FUNG|nr:mediator of RNA polymerase II transcription subunit 13 [Apophysomyces ossiformis]